MSSGRPGPGELRDTPTADWDDLAVRAPGGHAYQSTAWAEHRRRSGWRPRFHVAGDARTLALVRPWPLLGGGSAYVPRGPAPVVDGAAVAARLAGVTAALAGEGIDVVAADPEVPAADPALADALRAAGWHPIEEIQPSRHRLTLPLGPGADEAALWSGLAKSTRQRIRAAEKARTVVVRFDAGTPAEAEVAAEPANPAAGATTGAGASPGPAEFARPAEPPRAAFERFAGLLRETGERRGFGFGPSGRFVAWWLRGLEAGIVVHLEARVDDEPIAGLLLYRQGGRISTVHSADRADLRRSHPGVLHLLRWRALQVAVAEACLELDLGGVDTAGGRHEPREGDPTFGLYEHKRSFGGTWLELTGAHERVLRSWRYAAGRVTARVAAAARR